MASLDGHIVVSPLCLLKETVGSMFIGYRLKHIL